MTSGARPRLDLIDWLRGFVIVLMALDHTRDFVGDMSIGALDLSKTNPLLYFTRWVTHLCAPTFVFLTGVGAYLMRGRGRSTASLSVFLFTRGAWMMILEVTWVKTCWELYGPNYGTVGYAVFGAIGAGMMALALLVWLPRWLVGYVGLLIVFGHNAYDPLTPESLGPVWGGWWRAFHAGGPIPIIEPFQLGSMNFPKGIQLWSAYPLGPWIGVIAVGYALGDVFTLDRPERRRTLALLGLGCWTLFLMLRGTNLYGDPRPWPEQDGPVWTVLAVLNCEKYPPSLAYTLATLGTSFLLAAAADRAEGPPGKWIVTFGRVPLFFYLLHLPVIHLFGLGIYFVGHALGWYGPLDEEFFKTGLRVPLWGVYLVWAAAIFVLYWPCRWWAGVKQRHRSPLLSYL